jgi:hypothetical protein
MASKAKEFKALERLTAKLSALRKTLRGDERKQLDAMVLGASSEVAAHSRRQFLCGRNRLLITVTPFVTLSRRSLSKVQTNREQVRGVTMN